jgi:hypothetical protein
MSRATERVEHRALRARSLALLGLMMMARESGAWKRDAVNDPEPEIKALEQAIVLRPQDDAVLASATRALALTCISAIDAEDWHPEMDVDMTMIVGLAGGRQPLGLGLMAA